MKLPLKCVQGLVVLWWRRRESNPRPQPYSPRHLRVQSTDELFPFPRSPSTGVGSGSFIDLRSYRLKAL